MDSHACDDLLFFPRFGSFGSHRTSMTIFPRIRPTVRAYPDNRGNIQNLNGSYESVANPLLNQTYQRLSGQPLTATGEAPDPAASSDLDDGSSDPHRGPSLGLPELGRSPPASPGSDDGAPDTRPPTPTHTGQYHGHTGTDRDRSQPGTDECRSDPDNHRNRHECRRPQLRSQAQTRQPDFRPINLEGSAVHKTRANISIGTLNIKGASTDDAKWDKIHDIIKDENLAVLALQETHVKDDKIATLNRKFERTRYFTHTFDRDHSRSGGVAIIINKQKLPTTNIHTKEIIPGRAVGDGVW